MKAAAYIALLLPTLFIAQRASAGTSQPADPNTTGISIADLEAQILRAPGCKKDLADTADLATDLKGKYGIVSCYTEIDGWQQIILVPKDSTNPGQQLIFGSQLGFKLLRARFVDHCLVLEFDTQSQYLDLLKPIPGAAYELVAFVENDPSFVRLTKFEDVHLFKDALKHYAGVADGSPLLNKIDALTAKASGGKRYRIETSYAINGERVVIVTSDGNIRQIWPESKK